MMSGIQHFSFCKRQWALIHIEQQWAENLHTALGRLDHARCHDGDIYEKRGNILTIRNLRVVSHRLHLSGNCDVVDNSLILQQKTEFVFQGRNKRPPTDNVNALLSFTYTILANNCAAALQSVGLDPYVGFMHRLRPGRSSLALDLMEELRPVMADRFVLSCINKRVINAKHFDEQESGAVWLNEDGRKAFFKAWQERKQESITHPFLKEKVAWGLVPYTQALLLSRSLRGDLDDYPPFLWK